MEGGIVLELHPSFYSVISLNKILLKSFKIIFNTTVIQSRYAVVWNACFHHQGHLDLSNIWLMFNCLNRFILIVNGLLLISYDRV